LRLFPEPEVRRRVNLEVADYVIPAIPIPAADDPVWRVAVIPDPHGTPDYFTDSSFSCLFTSEWTVHYNSNRLGVRFSGPKPGWARSTGGEAGLHPSNIHDSPYPVGGISFTGDEAVVLTCDGPSLGGFVVSATVVSADMWKMGQVRPGDKLQFVPFATEQAVETTSAVATSLNNLRLLVTNLAKSVPAPTDLALKTPNIGTDENKIIVRQAGDCAILLEFGQHDGFNLRQTIQIADFIARHEETPMAGIEELAPGVRSFLVTYQRGMLPSFLDVLSRQSKAVIENLQQNQRFPTRRVKLPFVFDDESSRAAVKRYAATIRESAPYLPSNVDFLQDLNFSHRQDSVEKVLHSSTFLVLGLGDVFLGSPCAVPLDPRQRHFGTKYNLLAPLPLVGR
jgi:urea carboxylase / allophanate hydrolase